MGGGVRRQLWLQTWFHSTPPLPPGALVSSSVKWQQNILRCWGFTHYPRKSWEVGLRGIPTQTHRQTEEWAQPPRLGGEGRGGGPPAQGSHIQTTPTVADSEGPWAASYTGSEHDGVIHRNLGPFLMAGQKALCNAAPSGSPWGPHLLCML